MAVKVKITGLEEATKTVRLKIARAIKQSDYQSELQEEAISEIRTNGIKPDLKPSTIKNRKYLAKFNTTHKDYRAEKSNLTLTGELLNSLRVKFITSKLVFSFDSLKRKHKRYKTGGKGSISPSNRDIFDYLEDKGFTISQIFTREKFLARVTDRLKASILKYYRN